jgi:hypothetical protein
MLKHKWNPETMRSGFYAMLQHAELQEIEHETDVVLGSYWSGIKDALLVAVDILGEDTDNLEDAWWEAIK